MKPRHLIFATIASLPGILSAADIFKANNATSLNSTGSWFTTSGGPTNVSAIGSTDIGVFDSTVTGTLSVGGGSSLSLGGFRVADPGGPLTISFSTNATYTLNSAGIDMSAATQNLTIGTTVNNGFLRMANGNYGVNLNVASGRTLTINSNFTNQGNTKTATLTGAGNIIFNGSAGSGGAMSFNITGANVTMNNAINAWTSGTVTSGKLTIGNTTALQGQTVTQNAANGLAFATGITSATLGGLAGSSAGTFNLANVDSNAVNLSVGNNNSSQTFSGVIGGAGSITKIGSGTQTLSGNNSFAGGIYLNSGAITFGDSGAAAGGTVTASNGTSLNLANSSSVFLSGSVAVSGAASNVTLTSGNISAGFSTAFTGSSDQTLTVSGSNQVNLSSSSQQLSGFNGTVAVASGSTLRFSSSSLNNGGNNTTFDLTGGLVTRNNGFLSLGALSGSGNISMGGSGPNTGKLYLTVGAKNLSTTYSGAISDADSANGKTVELTKTGTATLTLNGASTYTGVTTINSGTLALGASGSIDNTSEISLASGGTFDVSAKSGYTVGNLTGSGTVIGAISISTELAIGNSPGTSDFNGDLTMGAGSVYTYEVVGGTSSADLGNVAGNLTLASGATLDLVQLGTYTAGNKYTLFSYSGSLSGTFAGLADDSTFTAGGGIWLINYNDTVAGANGGDFSNFVTVAAVPEPGAALLGGLGMLALLRRRRH